MKNMRPGGFHGGTLLPHRSDRAKGSPWCPKTFCWCNPLLWRSSNDGFTLLEVIVALAILAFMMAMAWGTIRKTTEVKKKIENIQDRYREVRVALGRLNRDLSMAYVSLNENRAAIEPRTFFTGESSADSDTLRFTTLSHTSLYANANESDETVISYFMAPGSNGNEQHLMRRETRRLSNEGKRYDELPGETNILVHRIVKFKVQYWDYRNQEWVDKWSTQSEGYPRIPERVRTGITFLDERGNEVTVPNSARLHLQEALQFYAQ